MTNLEDVPKDFDRRRSWLDARRRIDAMVLLAVLAFAAGAARADLEPPPLGAFGGLPTLGGPAATLQCLKMLVRATERTDVEVLQNSDLIIYSAKGTRVEKSNGRHATLDLNGNCATTNLAGRLGDRDSFNAIVLSAYTKLTAKEPVRAVCAQSDRQILRDLVRTSTGTPHLIPASSTR